MEGIVEVYSLETKKQYPNLQYVDFHREKMSWVKIEREEGPVGHAYDLCAWKLEAIGRGSTGLVSHSWGSLEEIRQHENPSRIRSRNTKQQGVGEDYLNLTIQN